MATAEQKYLNQIKKRVVALRNGKGWSIAVLAVKAQIGTTTVQRLEGGGDARITTIRKVAKALGVKVEDLIKS